MYEYEEDSDIIGLSCTLLNPYKGYTEGTIVRVCRNSHKLKITLATGSCSEGDFDKKGILTHLRLESGKEISEYRDEVIIHD